jgi:hypothetical protein
MVIAGSLPGPAARFVMHKVNESSGGKATHELGDFLRKAMPARNEHHALWQMIGGLLD